MSERDLLEEISVSLKRIADALEEGVRLGQMAAKPPRFVEPFDPERCGCCGEKHVGQICPLLAPKATTHD